MWFQVVKTLTESERHKTHTIKTLQEKLKTEVEKIKKEADIEAIRLVSTLQSTFCSEQNCMFALNTRIVRTILPRLDADLPTPKENMNPCLHPKLFFQVHG